MSNITDEESDYEGEPFDYHAWFMSNMLRYYSLDVFQVITSPMFDRVNKFYGVLQVVIAWLVMILNGYFLGCILLLSELRQWRYSLIGWQSLSDFLAIGMFNSVHKIWEVIYLNNQLRVKLDGPISDFFKENVICLSLKLSVFINSYTTGVILLVVAVERFIMVVLPFRAKFILTPKFYLATLSGVVFYTAVFVTLSLTLSDYPLQICPPDGLTGFFASSKGKFVGDFVQCLAVPATICLVLYIAVALKLLKKPSNHKSNQEGDKPKKKSEKEKRNMVLTQCFFITTVSWILLWGLFFFLDSFLILDWHNMRDMTKFSFLVHKGRYIYYNLNSVVAPVVFLVINRQFQKPFIALFAKVKGLLAGQ